MKCLICIAVVTCVFARIAIAAKPNKSNKGKETIVYSLQVDSDKEIYGSEDFFHLEEGLNKKITCKGSQKNQKIEWYDPDGNLVERDPTKSVYVSEPALSRVSSLVLVFSNTKETDSGIWECRSGELVKPVIINIMTLAEFVDMPEELSFDEGRSITLSCQVKGNPEPKITWDKDGELLVDDGEKYFTSMKYNRHTLEGLLTIKSLTPEDMGVYLCVAEQVSTKLEGYNNTSYFNITLNVNHAPRPRKEASRSVEYIFAQNDENLTLVCDPTAYPKPQFRWFSHNMATELSKNLFQVLENGMMSTLSIIANSSTLNKTIICKAKNDFGEVDINFKILKLQKPVELTATTDFVPWQRTILFNVSSEDDFVVPVDGYEIQYFEKTTIGEPRNWQWNSATTVDISLDDNVFEDSVVPLKNLKINTEYWARIRAYNVMGTGPWSKHILASTAYERDVQPAAFGVFLGIIVTAVIVVFGAACIVIIKKL